MIRVIIAPSLATIDDRERISSRPICGEPMWSNARKSEISHYRRFLGQRFDPLTEERVRALIADLESQIEGLHCRSASDDLL